MYIDNYCNVIKSSIMFEELRFQGCVANFFKNKKSYAALQSSNIICDCKQIYNFSHIEK